MIATLLVFLLWPQIVVRHEHYSTVDAAPTAYQPRDMTIAPAGPYFVLIGENKSFCAVTSEQYASVLDGEKYDCRWQMPRN